jgi:hypothetical protein
MRLAAPKRTPRGLMQLIEVAERYADGEAGEAEFDAARRASATARRPRAWGGDLGWAFLADDGLRNIWAWAVRENRTYRPGDWDYHRALPRHRVFEELLGPDPPPDFSPSWRTDTAVTLAHTMYDSRDFSAMPIFADALQDAGCDNEDILNHCRDTRVTHIRGCWVVDLVLGKS